jgi:hypothetical protein
MGEAMLASYVKPDDVVVDVGGGNGRLGLMLALRCREVINVEPLQARGTEFEQAAAEAAITNARLVRSDWIAAQGVVGDVTLASHVTYGVPDIVPFIEKLVTASRRRVMIVVYGRNQTSVLMGLLREAWGGEPQLGPYHQFLLPILWEMDILPDVRVMGLAPSSGVEVYESRDDAVQQTLRMFAITPERGRDFVETHFDEICAATPEGFRPRWLAPELLITWETGGTLSDPPSAAVSMRSTADKGRPQRGNSSTLVREED